MGHAADDSHYYAKYASGKEYEQLEAIVKKYKHTPVPPQVLKELEKGQAAHDAKKDERIKYKQSVWNESMECKKLLASKIGVNLDVTKTIKLDELGEALAETNVDWRSDPEAVKAWDRLMEFQTKLSSIDFEGYSRPDLDRLSAITMIADIYDALNDGKYFDEAMYFNRDHRKEGLKKWYPGHGSAYYTYSDSKGTHSINDIDEIVANFVSLSICNPASIQILRDSVPELVDALDKYIAMLAR